MEVGPPRGRWAMKWNRDPLQLSGAVTAPLTATSGPFFLQPRGLSRQGSLLPVPCSWGQTASQRQVRLTFVWPVPQSLPQLAEGIRQFSAVTYFHSPELHSGQCGQLSAHTVAPLPRFNFFHAFVRNFKLDQSSQNSFFFVVFIEKCHTRSKTKHLAKTLSHICH